MRNNIISLEKYFSIFAYLSVVRLQFGQNPMQKNFDIEFFPNCNQAAGKIEKYLYKERILFLIYLEIYFLANRKCQYRTFIFYKDVREDKKFHSSFRRD